MEKLRVLRLLNIFCLSVILFVSFQNCTKADFGKRNESAVTPSNSGGQPYDGKPFLLYGACADGSRVTAKIVVYPAGNAEMVRENCVDVSLSLTSSDFSSDPVRPGQIVYLGQTFVAAPQAAPGSKLAYAQWSGNLLTISPAVYAIDGMGVAAAQVTELKDSGHTVICMIDGGVYSSRFADAASFQPGEIGNSTGAPDERWLDTRSPNVRAIMLRRLGLAQAKGCDGVMWNQTDGFTSANPGFPLNTTTGIDYARFLSAATHDRGLHVALANTRDIAASLADDFDFVFAESCVSRGTCGSFQSFLDRGKALYADEHGAYSPALCAQAAASRITMWFSTANADGSRYEPCP